MDLPVERPGRTLAVAMVVAALGWASASQIAIAPELEALLPDEAVEGLAEARRRYAGDAPMYFVVESSNAATNRALSRELLGKVQAWEETEWAISRRDPAYFSRHRLLYLPQTWLEQTADDLEVLADWVDCEKHPLCTNLEERPPPPSADDLRQTLEAQPNVRTLLQLFGIDSTEALTGSEGTTESEGAPLAGDLCRPDGELCLVYAVLRGHPSDVEYAERAVYEAKAILDGLDHDDDVELRVGGRYARYATQRSQIGGDLVRTGLISVLLMAMVLALQFRGLRWIPLLLAPLATAAGWLMLILAWLAPPLNVMSAATLAIFAGIGVDFGVHLLTVYGEESRSRDPAHPVAATLRRLVNPLALAALTTTASFGALAFGRFAGFAQMGTLCALALLTSLISFLTVFPALAVLTGRVAGSGPVSWSWTLPALRPRAVVLVMGTLLAGAGGWALSQVQFEYDLKRITASSPSGQVSTGPALHGLSRSPTLLLADSEDALEAAAEGLRQEPPDGLSQDAPWLLTPDVFVPEAQTAKLASIARIQEAASRLKDADEDTRETVEQWEPYLDPPGAIELSQLPRWVLGMFTERDGSVGRVGILFEGGSASDARRMELRAERIAQWEARFDGVRFASTAAILGQITSRLRADTPRVVSLAIAALLLCVFAFTRKVRTTLQVAAPVLVSVLAAFLGMWLLDLKLNLFNVVVLPVAFGVGVDGAIYMVLSSKKEADEEKQTTARAVLGSTLTTVAAFGSLVFSSHPGLSSLGELACLMLLATLAGNLFWLPSLLRWTGPRARRELEKRS